jgi:hypothetical protein
MQSLGGMKGAGMLLGCLLLGCLLLGCGAGARTIGKGGPEFPSRGDLSEILSRPLAAAKPVERSTLSVDEWQPGEASQEPATEAEEVLKRVATAKKQALAIDAALGCAAREVARFFGKHKAFPDQQLQGYIAGVCGSSTPTFGVTVWDTPVDSVTDAAPRNEWHQHIAKQLGEWLPPAVNQAGAAELAEGGTVVFAATFATSNITWDKVSTLVDEQGRVELSGRLSTPASMIYGLSNVGAYGVQDCQSDPRVAAPQFRMFCQLDPADSSAWVSVQVLPPGRVLAYGAGRVLIRREGVALSFTAPTKNTAPESVRSSADFSTRLLSLVNETRAAARLPALKLAQRQSETSTRLTPHYFAGEGTDNSTNDQIALGLLAGWDIKGTIRSGDFYSNALSGSLDPRRWLAFMLEQPSARRVMLAPAARAIAIGSQVDAQAQSMGALVSTYSFYESDNHRADLERFFTRLNARRTALGLPPAKLGQAPELADALKSVKTYHDPETALNDALQQVVNRSGRSVEGYFIEATDLDYATFPEPLLRPSVTLALSATHHRYPEAAWGVLTVLIVILDSSGPQKTATLSRSPG